MAKVLLFGALGDLAGWSERDVPADTLGALRGAVAGDDARLGERLAHASTLVILNDALLPAGQRRDDRTLAPADEVAFGSPVSGG